MPKFVWLAGLAGPEPQIWYDVPKDGDGKLKHKPLFGPVDVGDETLNQLIVKYPKPVVAPDV